MTDMNKAQVLSMMNSSLDSGLSFKAQSVAGQPRMAVNASYIGDPTVESTSKLTVGTANTLTCWGYWRDYYYPTVIRESYPVYLTERAVDKGKQAFEIIKVLKDKKLVKLDKVGDFIDLMDSLISIL